MEQWLEWFPRLSPEDEVPNIDWLIAVFSGNKNYDGNPDPSIKSWAHPVGELKELMKKRCNLKGALVFCTYHWPNGLKAFSSGSAHKVRKDYQGVIHNAYHGGHIETDHHVICPMPEDVAKHFSFPNITTPVSGTSREVLDNNTTTREKSYLNGLGMKKVNL